MAVFVDQDIRGLEISVHHIGGMNVFHGAQEVVKDQLDVLLRNAGHHSLSHYLFQVRIFKLHDKENIIDFVYRSFLRRNYNVIDCWNETTLLISCRYLVQSFHDLDFSDQLNTIIVILAESFHVLDSHGLPRKQTLSLVNLTVAAFSNLFTNRILVLDFFPWRA